MQSPICLFTYDRLNETKQTIEALSRNYLAPESELYIFSDGPKNEKAIKKVEAVREYIKSISGFKTIHINKSAENHGLASSIILGVTQVLKNYESVIVLEDDLITLPNFLDFMNQALAFYWSEPKVQSVCGYSLSLRDKNREVNFQTRTFSWGWGTWRDRWNIDIFNKEAIRAEINNNPTLLKEFKRSCGADISKMLMDSINSKNDSWYVRWTYNHFRSNRYSVFPSFSFINNIGHNADATHCKGINTYISEPADENKVKFYFPSFQCPDCESTKEFLYYFTKKHKIIFRTKLLKTKVGRKQIFSEIKMRLGIS